MKGAYIGIVKETFTGVNTRIITKFSNDTTLLENWMNFYPNCKSIIMENNFMLEEFFKDFEDLDSNHLKLENQKVVQKMYDQLTED